MGEKKDSGGPEEREREMEKSGEKKENFIFVDPTLELLIVNLVTTTVP